MSEGDSSRSWGLSPPAASEGPSRSSSTTSLIANNVDALAPLEDGVSFLTYAARSLAQDEFSRCFEPKEESHYQMYSMWCPVYLTSWLIRYIILFPLRVLLCCSALVFVAVPLILFADATGRIELKRRVFFLSFKLILFCLGAWVRCHGRKPQLARTEHIFVANHTSFVDYILVSAHVSLNATVAQVHGGLFGIIQKYILSLNGSLSFQRNLQRDRAAVSKAMKEHVRKGAMASPYSAALYPPLLIFPEGTCVNNDYTVLFHKGAFELDCVVCPVAIKYNKAWLDPYWNTRLQSFTRHLAYLMTRWCMVVDIWWLPPQRRHHNETAIEFANRVKAMISAQASLKNLSWDGYLKNAAKSHDVQKLRRRTQDRYVNYLKARVGGGSPVNSSIELLNSGSMAFSYGSSVDSRPLTPPVQLSSQMFPPWLPESSIIEIQNALMQVQQ